MFKPKPRPRRPSVRRAKSKRDPGQEPQLDYNPDSNPDTHHDFESDRDLSGNRESNPDQELNPNPALDLEPGSFRDDSSGPDSGEYSTPNSASFDAPASTGASKPPSRSARRAASSPAKPSAMPNLKTHTIARWLSYIPLPPRQPGNEPPGQPANQPPRQPGNQPQNEPTATPDPAWQDQCPCGNPLPCAAHGDLRREVRYTTPWDTTWFLALTLAGIPIHLPDLAELPESAYKFLALAKSNLEKIPEYQAAHAAAAADAKEWAAREMEHALMSRPEADWSPGIRFERR